MKFSENHIWVDSRLSTAGISDYAQNSLGDIVYIDLPEVGQVFHKGAQFGSIESVKSVSPLIAPLQMKVLDVNEILENEPELINTNPYGKGWMVKIEVMNKEELGELLPEEDYLAQMEN
ncbi:MAG: glycine cleavage system protein GcvH [Peptococcaceae bacterium]